jgi:hypothetical protein
MQLHTLINKQHPAIYAAALFAVLIPLYYAPWQYHTAQPPSNDFVADWLNVHLLDPFNPSAISACCNTTTWRSNLVFNLPNAKGGIDNGRGNILDFLFFALEAGASIILLGMASRSETEISNFWASCAPPSLFFDEEWFIHAIAESCPQMKVHKFIDKLRSTQVPPGNYFSTLQPPHGRLLHQHQTSLPLAPRRMALDPLTPQFRKRKTHTNKPRTHPLANPHPGPPSFFLPLFPQFLRINLSIRRLAALTSLCNSLNWLWVPAKP